jgi:signal peptidase
VESNHPTVEPQGSTNFIILTIGRICSLTTKLILVFSCIVALIILTFTISQMAFGFKLGVVQSGSMAPGMPTGSLIVTKTISSDQIKVGDVITFHPPDRGDISISHRVVRIDNATGVTETNPVKAYFVTKGDANPIADPWKVGARGDVDRRVYSIPYAGFIFADFHSPQLRAIALSIPASLLILALLLEMWIPKKREANGSKIRSQFSG